MAGETAAATDTGWKLVYREVNERFAEKNDGYRKAQGIIAEIEALKNHCLTGKHLPPASLFFMGAKAYLSECHKVEAIEMRRRDQGAKERAKAYRQLKKSLKNLQNAIGDVEQKTEEGIAIELALHLPRAALQGVREATRCLVREINSEEVWESIELPKEISNALLEARSVPKTMSPKDQTREAFAAFQGIAKLISRARGRDYGAKTDASRLLSRWGIDIKTDTAKKKRQKKNRDQVTQKGTQKSST